MNHALMVEGKTRGKLMSVDQSVAVGAVTFDLHGFNNIRRAERQQIKQRVGVYGATFKLTGRLSP